MPLTKAERKQLNRYLDAITTNASGGEPASTNVGPGEQGAPPPAVLDFINRIMPPTPGADPAAVAARNANLAEFERQFNEAHFVGKFGVETLTPQDMAYIASVQAKYFEKTGKDIMRDGLIGGKNVHLNAVRRDGEALLGQHDLANYNSPLKEEVERRLKA